MEGVTMHVIAKEEKKVQDKENKGSADEKLLEEWLQFQVCLKNLGVKIKSNSPVAFDFVKG